MQPKLSLRYVLLVCFTIINNNFNFLNNNFIIAYLKYRKYKIFAFQQSYFNTVAMNKNLIFIRTKQDGPFVWNEPLQGLILSSYFWGYMVSLIPGGRMADLLSAKWVMNGSVLLNLVASILSPVAANMHYSLFILMRVIQGIGGVSIWKIAKCSN